MFFAKQVSLPPGCCLAATFVWACRLPDPNLAEIQRIQTQCAVGFNDRSTHIPPELLTQNGIFEKAAGPFPADRKISQELPTGRYTIILNYIQNQATSSHAFGLHVSEENTYFYDAYWTPNMQATQHWQTDLHAMISDIQPPISAGSIFILYFAPV